MTGLRAFAAEPPSFSGDIRPILSQHCFKCHGPDKQKSELRLDVRDAALKPAESGERAIVPGQPEASELLLRVTSHDKDEVMPPKDEPLTAEQIAKLRAWIAAGAEYEAHWAYVKPVRPEVPAVPASALEIQNPIDAFIAARLERAGRQPSPPADRYTLIRRVSLDLTGLPPTPEQADAFVADTAPDAYEKVVDRLLASPHYGERWATPWLDLARYGDSAGYQHDVEMPLWPYRDWVIRAFNADLPFDQFTRWQIAGDLLPREPDNFDPVIATGFHRGATATLGADQNHEELRAQLLWDRVNTVGATWLGETLECAQCHTHKFDPITQTDYYRLYAYFNRTVNELTKVPGSHYFITGGVLELPDAPERRAREQALRAEIRAETDAMIEKLQQATRKELPVPLRFVMATPPEFREAERILFLLENLKERTPPIAKKPLTRLRELGRELMQTRAPRSLVLEEDANPPATHVLLRGSVRTPGEEVTPGTPAALHPLPEGAPPNRIGLAEWLVSRENPLTARVVVNRWWAEFFGTGLVSTPEDFGLQGELPTHPRLLDWLAVEFMEGGGKKAWSMKHIHKLIVMSATYRQSSRWAARGGKAPATDPQNRLLARGARFRLNAETLRDQALAVSGLLSEEAGGRPAMITAEEAAAEGEPFAWRRSVYLRQQRAEAYATFSTFDAPDRFACVSRRPRTNTPLQALALMNEPVFAFAAEALAKRVLSELPSASAEERATRLFRLCLVRPPQPVELAELTRIRERKVSLGGDESAAWSMVAGVLLNLDETITRE
ncbi:MAG: PSD1 and planctomycete cytochrome C domain-containing protein [Verrucomicrobiota bacterium]|nr:PSD1 and planctomycete cytochrome C domain-containing protein [Verrucomicrobiota bacterium]